MILGSLSSPLLHSTNTMRTSSARHHALDTSSSTQSACSKLPFCESEGGSDSPLTWPTHPYVSVLMTSPPMELMELAPTLEPLAPLTDADVADLELVALELELESLQPQSRASGDPQSSSGSALATGQAVEQHAKRETCNAQCKRRRRESGKQEVERLREEVERLSLELLEARDRASGAVAVRRSSRRTRGVWEAVADKQLRMREAAQKDNELLRKLVQVQRQHLRSMMRLAKRRPHRQEIDAQVQRYIGERIRRETPFGHDREEAFEFLLQLLTPSYAQLNDLWTRSRMSELPCPGRRVLSTRESTLKDMKFEAIQSNILPFDVKSVEHALWTHLANPRLLHPANEYSKLVGLHGDTLQLLLSIHNEEFNLKQTLCMASRKFEHEDCTVLVTLSLTEPRLFVNDATLGLKALKTVVRVLRPGEVLPTGDQTSVIESHWSLQGLNVDCTSACSAKLFKPFIDLGKAHMLSTMNGEIEMIEELLIRRQYGASAP